MAGCIRSAILSSPRAWGCFWGSRSRGSQKSVFPTCVGVFLRSALPLIRDDCLPHVRGGVSTFSVTADTGRLSSPRAWGCFYIQAYLTVPDVVFPTCVGVFLKHWPLIQKHNSLPHVRGGVSAEPRSPRVQGGSSPRAWGCFLAMLGADAPRTVFPTCVGVFLCASVPGCSGCSLPHVRGGVSENPADIVGGVWSSPRAWGCF